MESPIDEITNDIYIVVMIGGDRWVGFIRVILR